MFLFVNGLPKCPDGSIFCKFTTVATEKAVFFFTFELVVSRNSDFFF